MVSKKTVILIVLVMFNLFVSRIFAQNSDLPYEMGMKSQSVEEMMQNRFSANPSPAAIFQTSVPSRADLSSLFPPVRSQGMQNSCVAWSVAYATKSYQEKIKRGWTYNNSSLFSPAYIYNQINGGKDQGSAIEHAMDLIKEKGCATLSTAPYNPNDYRSQPSRAAHNEAAKYKAKSWHQVRYDDFDSIKSYLASGQPVNFGMSVDAGFYALNRANNIYRETAGFSYGGHAMVLVGYDDNLEGGCFKIYNSWGDDWGDNGYCWITYELWMSLRPHVLVMYDFVDPVKPSDITDVPKPVLPAKVTGIKASQGLYTDRISISWNSAKDATSYAVYITPSDSTHKVLLANVSHTEYFYNTVAAGNHQFTVRAFNDVGYGEESASATGWIKVIETEEEEPVPDVPTGLTASEGTYADKVTLKWNKADNAQSYNVYRKTALDRWQVIGKPRATEFTDTSPIEGINHVYAVSGVNDAGESGMSKIAVGFIRKRVTVTSIPPVPAKLSASMGTYPDKVVLNWNASKDAKDYRVFRYNHRTLKWEILVATEKTEHIDTDIEPNRWYSYAVRAGNELGYSEMCPAVFGYAKAAPKQVAPAAPRFVVASKGTLQRQIKIEWSKSDTAEYYQVYRWDTTSSKWQTIAKVTETSHSDSSIQTDTVYVYTVSAFNSAGNSKNNPFDYGFASFSFRSPSDVGTVRNLQASQGMFGNGVKIIFNPIRGIDRYVIFRKSQKDGSWKEIAEVSQANYIDYDTQKGIIYEYCVAPAIPGGVQSEVVKGWVAGKIYNEPPKAPTSIQYILRKDRNLIGWNVTFETEGYYVYRYDEERKTYMKIGFTMGFAFADKENIVNGKTYLYGVRSFNWAGESKDMITVKISR
jgi:fibronectin type 3 domain-containing protein